MFSLTFSRFALLFDYKFLCKYTRPKIIYCKKVLCNNLWAANRLWRPERDTFYCKSQISVLLLLFYLLALNLHFLFLSSNHEIIFDIKGGRQEEEKVLHKLHCKHKTLPINQTQRSFRSINCLADQELQ